MSLVGLQAHACTQHEPTDGPVEGTKQFGASEA